jgi:hypothetical protein
VKDHTPRSYASRPRHGVSLPKAHPRA